MRNLLVAGMILLLAGLLTAGGCGGEEKAATEGEAKKDAGATAATSTSQDDGGTAIPADVDFQAMGEDFVAAAAAGDCGAAADLQGWSQTGKNRDTAIANCEIVTGELAARGEPAATSTREEAMNGEVSVWVTRAYADGSEWEMQMTIRESTASNRDEGWVISTFSYGMSRQGG